MPSSSSKLQDQPIEAFVESTYDCESTALATQAAAYLSRSPSRVVLVTKPNSKELMGIITLHDLEKMAGANPPKDAEHLGTTENVVAVTSYTSLGKVAKILEGENSLRTPLKQVPVINSAGDAIGVITRTRVDQLLRGESRSRAELSF